jgi:hypothetical protein
MAMTAKKGTAWEDLKKRRHTPEQIEKIRADAKKEVAEYTLRQLREASGKTQMEMAALTEMAQSELSRFESRDDRKVSTLRRYVEALGGELEITAVINGRRIPLADTTPEGDRKGRKGG